MRQTIEHLEKLINKDYLDFEAVSGSILSTGASTEIFKEEDNRTPFAQRLIHWVSIEVHLNSSEPVRVRKNTQDDYGGWINSETINEKIPESLLKDIKSLVLRSLSPRYRDQISRTIMGRVTNKEFIADVRERITEVLKKDGVELSDAGEHLMDMIVEDIAIDYL